MMRRRTFLLASAGLIVGDRAHGQASVGGIGLPPPPLSSSFEEEWAQAERIPLWPGDPPGGHFKAQPAPSPPPPAALKLFGHNIARPQLHVFRAPRPNGLSVMIIPGGAYRIEAFSIEGFAVAKRLNELGTTAFVLEYRLPGEGWALRADVPLQDAQRAMRLIRALADRFDVNPALLTALGFSAGGHLAATLAVGYSENIHRQVDDTDQIDARPFATALVYPVVTMMKPWTHELSRNLLLGDNASDEDVARRSPEFHIGANTPPTFLVHAFDDQLVPVENSLRMIDALRAARRPVEAHLLQEGGHGFGIGHPGTPSEQWLDLFEDWLMRLASARSAGTKD